MTAQRHPSHYLLALALAPTLFALQCVQRPLEPVAPTWDVDLTAPVTVQSYTLQELVEKDTSILAVEPGGTMLLVKTSVSAEPTLVGDNLSLNPFNTSFQAELGPFTVPYGGASIGVHIPGLTPGSTIILPPMPPTDVADVGGMLPFISWVEVQSGLLRMTVRNAMPVPITIEHQIRVMNSEGNPVVVFDFAGARLAPGESRSSAASVAGSRITKHFVLESIRLSSEGSGGATVTIPDSMLVVSVSPENVVATDARLSAIPPQHVNLERSIPLTSQTLVREAWLNRGDLSFQIVNNADLSMTLRFRLPELLGPTGQVYEQVLTLSPRDSRNVAVNLARHRITSSGGGFLRALRAECTVDALAGGAGDTITVHATDFVSVGVTSGLIVADSIVAALQPTLIAVDETVGLNLSSISDRFRGSLEIPAGDLRFTPRTSVNVPAELNLTLQGRDAGGRVVSLAMPAQKATAQLSAVDFAAADVGNFLTQFAGRLPDSLRVVGTLLLNPDYDTASATAIGRNCSFAGDVDLAVPLRLRIAGGSFADTLVLGDTTADGRSDKRLDDDLLNGMQTARIVVEIDNGLPLAVALRVDLLDRSRNRVLTLPQTAGDSVLVAPGVVINGDVQSSTRTVRILEISGSELRQFNVADLVRLSLGLSTPGTTYVNFRATDRVRVRVWTQSCYRVNA